ncbi:MAG TPA: alpha/beta hydrolase [Mycobacterium sp.]|nr:alpha/beta hydrolase [Mycobacterium sp.]
MGSATTSRLEVIDKGRCSGSHPVPLVFVHGAFQAAWCWDENFLDFFAGHGYRAVAFSLRGHGSSPSSKPVRSCSIADYVEDLCSVCAGLSPKPVVIGHSMGGFVVQKYLETHDAPGAVLMASAPPRGHLGALTRLMRQRPGNCMKFGLTGDPSDLYGTSDGFRNLYFSERTPDAVLADAARRFQPDSLRALNLDMTLGNRVTPERVSTSVLVLGGHSDGTYRRTDVLATAAAYRTVAEFFPDTGHQMMLDSTWASVAQRIHMWLASRGL